MNPWITESKDEKSGLEYQVKLTDTEILARIVRDGLVRVSESADHRFVFEKFEELVDFHYWMAQDSDARNREMAFDLAQPKRDIKLHKVQHKDSGKRGYCVSTGSNGLQRVRWFDNTITEEEPRNLKYI